MPPRQRHSTGRMARVAQPGQVNEKHVKITRPDRYILTIGFEVNNEKAYTQKFTLPTPVELIVKDKDYFSHNNQNLSEDFGHAFIYVTKNDIVMSSFSFGPAENPSKANLNGFGNRPGDTLYPVSEVAKLFRFKISKEQAEKVQENTEQFTQKVESQQIHYAPYKNDTCAASAKEILDQSNIDTPSGKSYASYEILGEVIEERNPDQNSKTGRIQAKSVNAVRKTQFSTHVPIVTPYEWYHELLQQYSSPEPISFENTGVKRGSDYTLGKRWVATVGKSDPLLTQQRKILHGILGQDQSFDMKELQDFSNVPPPAVPEIQPLNVPNYPSNSKK